MIPPCRNDLVGFNKFVILSLMPKSIFSLKNFKGPDGRKDISIPKELEAALENKIGADYLYEHANIYDLAYKGYPGDIDFYKKIVKSGKVLYLGIGSGRVYLNLIKINSNVYGLDYSQAMIKRMREKNPAIDPKKLIFANVLKARIENESFDIIIAPFSFFTQFEEEDVMQIFTNCYRWLKKDGKLVTDFFSPYLNPPYNKNFVKAFTKKSKNKVKITSYEFYDYVKQRLYEFTLVNEKGRNYLVRLDLSYYFPNQINLMAKKCGLKTVGSFGDFKKNLLTTKSKVMVFIFQKERGA